MLNISIIPRLAVGFSAACILAALTALAEPRVEAFGVCCQFGEDCSGDALCCDNENIGAMPCNPGQEREGYCLAVETCLGINDR